MMQTICLLLLFPCLARLALMMARFLCSSLISIPVHTNSSSGVNIVHHFFSFHPHSRCIIKYRIKRDSPISWSSFTLFLSLTKASNHLCLSSAFLQHRMHINSRVKAFRRRRAFFSVTPRSRSRPSGTSTTSVWSMSSRPR